MHALAAARRDSFAIQAAATQPTTLSTLNSLSKHDTPHPEKQPLDLPLRGKLKLQRLDADIAAMEQAVHLVKRAQGDAAARLTRLSTISVDISASDWAAVAAYAVSRQACDLAALRVVDRLRWLPHSHHWRFPIYEQVCNFFWGGHAYNCLHAGGA